MRLHLNHKRSKNNQTTPATKIAMANPKKGLKKKKTKPRTHTFTSPFRWLTVLTRSLFYGKGNFDSNSQNKNLQSLKILSGGKITDFYVVYVPCAQINSDDTVQLNF